MLFGQESLGPEFEWPTINPLVMRHRPNVLVHNCTFWDKHALIYIVIHACVWYAQWTEWIHAIRLLQDQVKILQFRDIVESRKTIRVGTDDARDFALGFGEDGRVFHHVKDEQDDC